MANDGPDNHGEPQQERPDPAGGRGSSGRESPDSGSSGGSNRRNDGAMPGPAADLGPILAGWPVGGHRPTVRLVRTVSGQVAIQVRLELGLLQLAFDGRPDGRRPHGADSLLTWHQSRLEAHRTRVGSDEGFELSSKECEGLREEGVQVYHRYVALFALEEYEAVVRDTSRNLAMFELCRNYGASQGDRTVLEQYRPFVVMMRARAEAAIALTAGDSRAALAAVERALAELQAHFEEQGPMGGFEQSSEATLLRGMRDALVPRLPASQRSELEDRLRRAVQAENFELAAILRDELRSLEQ